MYGTILISFSILFCENITAQNAGYIDKQD